MAVNLPVQNFFNRITGPAAYSRPACWPVITDVATEVQFLFCDLGDASCQIRATFTRTSGSQNMIIDWGDGTINTVTTIGETNTAHTYTPGTGTPCPSLGYTTFKIRVYFTGTGVSVLNNCNIMAIPISTNSLQVCNVLEAYYGDSTQNATPVNFYSVQGSNVTLSFYTILQFVKLPATVSWTSWNTTFNGCELLIKVVMPTSNSNANNYSNAFFGCNSLLEITIPSNSTGITTLQNTFDACNNLRSVTLPSTLNQLSFLLSTFRGCTNLKSLTLPSINNACCIASCFQNCTQLEWVKFTSMPTMAGLITFGSVFLNCSNLQNVYFPATGTATSIYDFDQTFSGCGQLKTITLPSNINVSIFSSTFNNCYALTSCILPTSSPSGTTYSSTFNNCNSLLKITLPAAPTASVPFIATFSNCWKLEEITIPSGYNFSSLISTFNNCYSLKTLSWTPGVQNSLTTLNNTFNNCYILTSITMPTSMTALNTLTSVFTNCYMLTSVILPSTLNSVTSMTSCFNSCRSLTSVTLPTSMSACTNFSTAFAACKIISSITLPNTVGAVTTFNSTFSSCINLKTCVLPGAAQLSLVTDITGMFTGCSNLTTLTNFEKIGSLTATPKISQISMVRNRFAGGSAILFSGPLLGLALNANYSNIRTDVQSVRLLNASAGQWTGSSPQINVALTNMSTAQIVLLFNDMAAQGTQPTTKTINITGATGAAGLTAADRLIVTSKNWTITG